MLVFDKGIKMVVCERRNYFTRTLAKSVEETKLQTKIFNRSVASFQQPSMTKRRQIEACIYVCRIIKRKSTFSWKE